MMSAELFFFLIFFTAHHEALLLSEINLSAMRINNGGNLLLLCWYAGYLKVRGMQYYHDYRDKLWLFLFCFDLLNGEKNA